MSEEVGSKLLNNHNNNVLERGHKLDEHLLSSEGERIQIVSSSLKSGKTLEDKRSRAVFRQIFMVFLANLGCMSNGLGLGVPAVTLEALTNQELPVYLTKDQGSWYASFASIACPIGGILVSCFLDKVGRRNSLYITNVMSIIGWGLMAVAVESDQQTLFIQLLVSRFIVGVMTGIAVVPIGVYAAEICYPSLRGSLTLGSSISIATGISVMYILGYFIRTDWKLIAIIVVCYSSFCLMLTFFLPASPNWLLSKHRVEEARRSLRYFRGINKDDNTIYPEIEEEFNKLEKLCRRGEGVKKPPFLSILKVPEVYKPLLFMFGFFFLQQFSGIFVVITYAVQISLEAGVTIDPVLCAIFVGIARVITTLVMGPMLDKFGRRPLTLFSGVGMTICMFLLACNSWFNWNLSQLPVTCIILYIITSTLGFMTLPFSMNSEIFPQKARGPASGLSVCFGFLMGFTIIKLYPSMVDNLGKDNLFGFYGAVSLVALVYVYFLMPETKGKTLQEIEEYFKYGKHHKQDVEMKDIFIAKDTK